MFIKRNEYSVYMNKQTLANTWFTVTFTHTEMFEFALAGISLRSSLCLFDRSESRQNRCDFTD